MHFEAGSQEKWSGAERAEQQGLQVTQAHEQSAGLLMNRESTDVINKMRGPSTGFSMSDLTLFDPTAEMVRKGGSRVDVADAFSNMDRAGAVAIAVRNMPVRDEVRSNQAA